MIPFRGFRREDVRATEKDKVGDTFFFTHGLIYVSTELEMTSDARQNDRKTHYVKHCKCA